MDNQIKVLVVDVDSPNAFSVAKLLDEHGVSCDIVTVDEIKAMQRDNTPVLDEMIYANFHQLKSMDPLNSCWWQRYYGKNKKPPTFW
jgi:hypothetical protein